MKTRTLTPKERVHTFSSSLFSYSSLSKTFTAEASDLKPFSLEKGKLVIKSARTGVSVEYELHETQTDREGDVQAWHFVPTKASAKHAAQTKVNIFND
jgi:hypothetical protein